MRTDAANEINPEIQPAFSTDWFESCARPVWDHLIPGLPASRVLEVGSYEGASACYLIAHLGARAPLEIHCIDTWEETDSFEGGDVDMGAVEARFRHNTQILIGRSAHPVTLEVHKGYSDMVLARLLTTLGKGYFDLVYIDGSHRAPDVLADAVMGFMHLRRGGIMVFDDYLWRGAEKDFGNPVRSPKLAIDAFINCNYGKVHVIPAPLYQLYVQKVSD
nr:class I SAM-dependent methyltransferase [uncultured Noviherbaspirillum sp.]